MLHNYGFVGVLAVVALMVPMAPIILIRFIAPRKPNRIKNDTYECGMETIGDAWGQFKVQYYIYALLFLVFDVETAFLYPWAVAYKGLGFFAFVEAVIFILILVLGLAYAWRKQVLRWY